MILGGPCTCWKRLRLASQCDRQEIDVFLQSEIQDGFRRRFGLHLESRWVQISSRGLISSEKVDRGTSIEFHMIFSDCQQGPQAEKTCPGEGQIFIRGGIQQATSRLAGYQLQSYNLTITILQEIEMFT